MFNVLLLKILVIKNGNNLEQNWWGVIGPREISEKSRKKVRKAYPWNAKTPGAPIVERINDLNDSFYSEQKG